MRPSTPTSFFIRMCSRGLIMLLPCTVLAQVSAGPAALSHKAVIASSGSGPYFQLTVPTTIYPTAANADLSDVRVRNANGNLVPHAWLDATINDTEVSTDEVPFYPVPSGNKEQSADQTDLSLQFRRDANGALLVLKSKPATPKKSATPPAESNDGPDTWANDWVFDVSQIKGRQISAQVTVNEKAEGLFPLTLTASDDLRHWHKLNADAQIAVLKHAGNKVEKLAIDLHRNGAKFLRLHWINPAQPIALTSVRITSVRHEETIPPMQWSGTIRAASCASDYCDYLLPAKTPLASLRINLGEPNSLAVVTISAQLPRIKQHLPKRPHPLYALHRRLRAHDATTTAETAGEGRVIVGRTVLYRLTQPNGEVRSDDLALDGSAYTHLRIRTDGPITMLGQEPPSIDVASTPRRLVFLGRGAPPFTLHWGVSDIGPALPPATLIPGYSSDKSVRASLASVDIPPPPPSEEKPLSLVQDQSKTPEPPTTVGRQWLWVTLAAGLLLLAAMAWSLFRSMERAKKTDDPPTQAD